MEINTPGLLCLPSERKQDHEIEGSVSIVCSEQELFLENIEGFLTHKERKAPQEVDENNVITFKLDLKTELEEQKQHIECEERPDTKDEVEIDPDFKKKIGSGAYGEVFLVKSSSKLQIALKEILKTNKNAEEVENEIYLHMKLDHIHVVKFLKSEIKTVDQREKYNIYLEYVPSSLKTFLSQHSFRRDENYVLFFLRQLVDGVQYLHSQKVVHCDIKCDNILVDDHETLKICDFGLAHDLRNGNIMSFQGTPNFAAPEVCNPPKEGFGESADVWSIGCTCLEMLTGYAPFYELESLVIIFQMGYGILKIEEKLQGRFSPECEDLMLSCWKREVSERSNIEELCDSPFLNGKSAPLEVSDEESEEEDEGSYDDSSTPKISFNQETDDEETRDVEADIDYSSCQPQNDVVLLQKTCVAKEMQSTFVRYDMSIKREERFEEEEEEEEEIYLNN